MLVNVRAELVDICRQLRIGTINGVLQIERIETLRLYPMGRRPRFVKCTRNLIVGLSASGLRRCSDSHAASKSGQ
jgi:hypothetical protein